MMKPSEKSESEEYMMGEAYRVAKQAYDKKDKTMTTRDAGLTQEQVGAVKCTPPVHLIAARSRARAHLAAIRQRRAAAAAAAPPLLCLCLCFIYFCYLVFSGLLLLSPLAFY
jgi:hypothetical protein